MIDKNILGTAKELANAAKETEGGKAATEELGKTALTITKAVNNVFLPIAAVNYGFDKAKIYFQNRFAEDFREATDEIPASDIVEPKTSIAAQTLEGLSFSHEEENLRKLYLNLLGTSVDGRKQDLAHPAFVEIIRQLTSEEAGLFEAVIREQPSPIVKIVARLEEQKSIIVLKTHVMALGIKDTNEPVVLENLSTYIDNWIRLGLVNVDYSVRITDDEVYKSFDTRPEIVKLRKTTQQNIDYKKGIIELTDFGRSFRRAVSKP